MCFLRTRGTTLPDLPHTYYMPKTRQDSSVPCILHAVYLPYIVFPDMYMDLVVRALCFPTQVFAGVAFGVGARCCFDTCINLAYYSFTDGDIVVSLATTACRSDWMGMALLRMLKTVTALFFPISPPYASGTPCCSFNF